MLSAFQMFQTLFQYDRQLISQGEYWRLVTCHFTHVSWMHLLLNGLGLSFLVGLFAHLHSGVYWLLSACFGVVFTSVCLFVFVPQLQVYVGLSGLLYAFLVVGLVEKSAKGRFTYRLALVAVLIKVVVDTWVLLPGSTALIVGGRVVAEAHFYGVLSGLCITFFGKLFDILPSPY